MSWSLSVIGKPKAVAEKIAADFASMGDLHEPHTSIRQQASELLAVLLASQQDDVVVEVIGHGSFETLRNADGYEVDTAGNLVKDHGSHANGADKPAIPVAPPAHRCISFSLTVTPRTDFVESLTPNV